MQKYDCFESVPKIEQKILTLVRKFKRGLTRNETIELHELFADRKRLLNKSCPYTEENLSALKEINRELENLTLLNRKRALNLVRFISDIGICSECGDWKIKAYLIVDGDMGGIELSDEKAYGSNFNEMRPILASVQKYIALKPFNTENERFAKEEIEEETLSEDPQLAHWNEPDYDPDIFHKWFVETVRGCDWICHYQKSLSPALHQLLRYRFWSVPDLLRLRFSTEADVELKVDQNLKKGIVR